MPRPTASRQRPDCVLTMLPLLWSLPPLGAAAVARPQVHRGAVAGAAAGDVEALAALRVDEGVVGVAPLLVPATGAVVELQPDAVVGAEAGDVDTSAAADADDLLAAAGRRGGGRRGRGRRGGGRWGGAVAWLASASGTGRGTCSPRPRSRSWRRWSWWTRPPGVGVWSPSNAAHWTGYPARHPE